MNKRKKCLTCRRNSAISHERASKAITFQNGVRKRFVALVKRERKKVSDLNFDGQVLATNANCNSSSDYVRNRFSCNCSLEDWAIAHFSEELSQTESERYSEYRPQDSFLYLTPT